MAACFIVRARIVSASDRDAFERWYRDEHFPDAVRAFGAKRAWRGWSDTGPLVHYALYEFDTLEKARALPGSGALQRLVAEFDRVWGERVVRERDRVEIVQEEPRAGTP